MKALAVFERDLKKFKRNPAVILMSVIMPLLYLIILGNSLQGELKNLPVGIVNRDYGEYSRRLIDLLRAIETGPETVDIIYMQDEREAFRDVRDGKLKAALIIPSDFSKKVHLGLKAQVGLFTDNTDAISTNAIVRALKGMQPYLKDEFVNTDPKLNRIEIEEQDLFKKVDYDASLVPGVIIMAIFLSTMFTGVFNLVMDKFLGVDESYLVTPLTKGDITIGVIVSSMLIATILAFVVLVASLLITGISLAGGLSSFAMILGIVVLTSLGLLGTMFVVLGRATHPRVVGIMGGFLNVILFFPSGAIYPVDSFPGWLKSFSRVNPETYAVDALKSVLFKGANFAAVSGDMFFLLVFTLVVLALATLSFKRTL